ncbi:hypothetical protein QQ045_028114 [Rhodiola kirilowii]
MSRHRRQNSLVLPLDLSEDWLGPDPATALGSTSNSDSNQEAPASGSSKSINVTKELVDPVQVKSKAAAAKKPPLAPAEKKKKRMMIDSDLWSHQKTNHGH